MRIEIGTVNADAAALIPPAKPDGSQIGINYADEYLKAINATLEDGRSVAAKRRGLKVVLSVGDEVGEGLMRRLDHGPDAQVILRHALEDAARDVGSTFDVDGETMYLEL